MRLQDLLQAKRADILRLAEQYGAHTVRVFGSVARGEDDEKSDIDLLVDMVTGRSLLDLGGLLMDLRELLGCEVDIVTEGSLRNNSNNDRIRNNILRDAISL